MRPAADCLGGRRPTVGARCVGDGPRRGSVLTRPCKPRAGDVSDRGLNSRLTFVCPNEKSRQLYVRCLENCALVRPVLAHLE